MGRDLTCNRPGGGRNPAGQQEAWRAVLHRNTPDGDLDFDGDVDQFDYATLSANLGATSNDRDVFYADGDLNADGRVDQADANSFLGLYQHRRRGDFNADGRIDLADFTLWRDHNGHYTGGLADATGDGWVNAADLALWRANLGGVIAAIPGQAAPEPSSAWLLLAVASATWRRSNG